MTSAVNPAVTPAISSIKSNALATAAPRSPLAKDSTSVVRSTVRHHVGHAVRAPRIVEITRLHHGGDQVAARRRVIEIADNGRDMLHVTGGGVPQQHQLEDRSHERQTQSHRVASELQKLFHHEPPYPMQAHRIALLIEMTPMTLNDAA